MDSVALSVKNWPVSSGDVDSIPGSGRSSGEGNGNPLQYSCLRNPLDREAWRANSPWGHKRAGHHLATQRQLSYHSPHTVTLYRLGTP